MSKTAMLRPHFLKKTPLAWFQVTREKTRLVVAIAEIAFADMLIFIQMGFEGALYDAAIQPHRNLDCCWQCWAIYPVLFWPWGFISWPLRRRCLPIAMTTRRAVSVLVMTIVMCSASGAIALRKLRSADPADIF